MSNKNGMSGVAKIAYLTRLLGKDAMVAYTNEFDRDTVEKIQSEIPDSAVLKSDADDLLEEFNSLMVSVINDSAVSGLTDAWDQHRNESLIKISPEFTGLQKLAKLTVDELFDFIASEEVLNQVVILNHLPIELAKGVFQKLSLEEKAKFTINAATVSSISDEQLKHVDTIIDRRLEKGVSQPDRPVDKVLPFTDTIDENELNGLLEMIPDELAEEIKANTITFTIVAAQSTEVLGLIFDELSSDEAGQALCTQPEELKQKIFSTCTNNRIKDIEYAIKSVAKPDDSIATADSHRRVVAAAKLLQSNGTITIER
ncbi:FliG C-terminal domain-containing protein [Photobacterium damselae]|uniref:FliG C-terminal domain-containing protein n=1 Tax=Photobacterium damselae TaxID=38293 RepID=UPI001F287A1E|nr:FliG C-terminal domain-containing protein [Photobacterium damselae]UKA04616.1 hypothetical protein IHC89_23645 [Photobacterium damselae subsp. damselae]